MLIDNLYVCLKKQYRKYKLKNVHYLMDLKLIEIKYWPYSNQNHISILYLSILWIKEILKG